MQTFTCGKECKYMTNRTLMHNAQPCVNVRWGSVKVSCNYVDMIDLKVT